MEKDSKKVVRIFSFASFFNDLGSEMAYPILPLFMREVLKANMGAIGVVDGLAESIFSLSQAFSGFVADRIKKRKIFIWIGYIVSGLSRFGYAISHSWPTLAGFRALNNIGKIREAPRDAMVADASFDGNRANNFGILRMMDNLGAVLGIVICILLFKYLGYRKIFLMAVIPSLLSAFLVLFFIKEKSHLYSQDNKNFQLGNLSKLYKKFLLISIIFALGSFSYSFLLIFATEMGFQETFVPILYLLFISMASFSSIPFGRLADKIGRKKVLMISYFLWALVCFIFISIKNYWALIIAFLLYGLQQGSLEPAQRAFVSEISPMEYRASGLGIYKMSLGLCALPSSLIAGLLWDKFNKFFPFYLGLLLAIISIFLLCSLKPKE